MQDPVPILKEILKILKELQKISLMNPEQKEIYRLGQVTDEVKSNE